MFHYFSVFFEFFENISLNEIVWFQRDAQDSEEEELIIRKKKAEKVETFQDLPQKRRRTQSVNIDFASSSKSNQLFQLKFVESQFNSVSDGEENEDNDVVENSRDLMVKFHFV